jgi:hypothetical protein
MPRIDAETVRALARAQGQHWVDAAAAERIAAGASAALAAVEATLRDAEPGLLASDGAAFADVLEALADAPR